MPSFVWIIVGIVACIPVTMGLFIMTAKSAAPGEASKPIPTNGKVAVLEGQRYLEYRIGIEIQAPPEKIWALLSNAAGFPSWNSTIISIEGDIAKGQKLALKAKVAPERTFPIEVAEKNDATMVWQDGNRVFKGVRTFAVVPKGDTTTFTMAEVFTGAFLPMIAPKLPDFSDAFNAFAADLKKAAEAA